MPLALTAYLEDRLAGQSCRLGQVCISAGWRMTHIDDESRSDLVGHSDPYQALEISRYDDAGKYRPLKSAPNLRHGWQLDLASISDLLLALDFFYPAAVGMAAKAHELKPVNLRVTLDRQTGMYAGVKKISDARAQDVAAATCNPQTGCLRKILWSIDSDHPLGRKACRGRRESRMQEIPLLCAEACNFFIGEARTVLKGNRPDAAQSGST